MDPVESLLLSLAVRSCEFPLRSAVMIVGYRIPAEIVAGILFVRATLHEVQREGPLFAPRIIVPNNEALTLVADANWFEHRIVARCVFIGTDRMLGILDRRHPHCIMRDVWEFQLLAGPVV